MSHRIVPLLLLIVTGIVCACQPEPSLNRFDSPSARFAAQTYYQYLVDDDYEAYVGAMNLPDSLTPRLRTFWVETMAQYAHALRENKGQVLQVQAVSDSLGEAQAQVFLDVMYADSVVEQISLPLVFRDGRWRIK